MPEERLDPAAQVRRHGNLCFSDTSTTSTESNHESDYGLLKDVDAMNTLTSPYLLAPTSFVDPPLSQDEIERQTLLLLEQFSRATYERFYGFAADPYPYVKIHVDDSAAFTYSVCYPVEVSAALKRPLSTEANVMRCIRAWAREWSQARPPIISACGDGN